MKLRRVPRLRRYFLVGLIILAPAGVTVIVLSWIFNRLDRILGTPLQAALGVRIPGLGFMLLGLAILLIGWVVHQAVGRRVLQFWNQALVKFPVVGRVYNAASQIVQALVSDQKRVFRRVVLVPFPSEGMWAVAFVTNEEAPVMSRIVGEPCYNVFLPTTPNPTSGFMLVVPRARCIEAGISVEEAMKLVISGGSLSPRGVEEGTQRRGLDIDTLFHEGGA
ncbi:MAG: DUF502 domain-containing protein [Gemmatimonadales bacterium]